MNIWKRGLALLLCLLLCLGALPGTAWGEEWNAVQNASSDEDFFIEWEPEDDFDDGNDDASHDSCCENAESEILSPDWKPTPEDQNASSNTAELQGILTESEFSAKMSALRTKYREGEYWSFNNGTLNETGPKKCNNTNTTCGGFYWNGKRMAGQCFGYVWQIAYLVFGSNYCTNSNLWERKSSTTNFYAGDHVRINNSYGGHSIFITKVDGRDVYYTECNVPSKTCQVHWDKKTTVDNLKKNLAWVEHLKGSTITGTTTTNAPIDLSIRASTTRATSAEVPTGGTTFAQGSVIYINGKVNGGAPMTVELYVTPPGGSESKVDSINNVQTWFWLGSGSTGYTLSAAGKYFLRIHAYNDSYSKDYAAYIVSESVSSDSVIDLSIRASTTRATSAEVPAGGTTFNQGSVVYVNGKVNSGAPLTVELYVTPPGGSESKVDSVSNVQTWFWLGSGITGYTLAESGTYFFRIHAYNGTVSKDYASNIISVNTKPVTYTVAYNANGGTGAPAAQTKTHGQTLTLSTERPTRSGYSFLGWAVTATATSAQYQPGGSYTDDENTTLYAVWKTNLSHLEVNGYCDGSQVSNTSGFGTFDVYINGVRVADDVTDFYRELTKGNAYEIRDVKPSVGHSFNGIYSGARLGNISGDATLVLNFTTINTSEIGEPAATLTENGHVYKYYPNEVTWYAAKQFCEEQGGHLATVSSDAENTLLRNLIGNNLAWLGGTCISGSWKWVTGEAFSFGATGKTYPWKSTEPNDSPSDEGGENYLHFSETLWNDNAGCYRCGFLFEKEVATYTIQYNANGGSGAPAAQTKTQGVTLTLSSTVPTRSGYTFLGWAESQSATAAQYQPGNPFTKDANTTLYAVWKSNVVSVTGVTLNKSSLTLNKGASETLTATVSPSNATNKSVTWTSSNTSVATVDGSGKVTAISGGTATITVRTNDGGKTATCAVTVIKEASDNYPKLSVESVTVTPGSTVTVQVKLSESITAKSIMFDLFEYDRTALTLVDGEWNLDGAIINNWDSENEIATAAFSNNKTLSGTIFRLTFQTNAKEEGDYTIGFTPIIKVQTGNQESDVQITFQLGMIHVASYQRGDTNGDGYVTSDDAIYLLRHTLSPARYPINQSGDMNGDKYITSDDAIYLLRHTLSPSRYPLL